MAPIGRNERCPCGSGSKYKHCCESIHRAARAWRARERDADEAAQTAERIHGLWHDVMDWLEEGLDEEAESAARRLLADYPSEMEGYRGMAEVEYARGHLTEAARWYRRALALHRAIEDHTGCELEEDLRDALAEVEAQITDPTNVTTA